MTFQASLVPAGMPAPHSPAPVPGLAQVSVPFGTTVQPFAFSRDEAAAGLNGYGLVDAVAGVNGLFGSTGTGPKAWPPAPLKNALM